MATWVSPPLVLPSSATADSQTTFRVSLSAVGQDLAMVLGSQGVLRGEASPQQGPEFFFSWFYKLDPN